MCDFVWVVIKNEIIENFYIFQNSFLVTSEKFTKLTKTIILKKSFKIFIEKSGLWPKKLM